MPTSIKETLWKKKRSITLYLNHLRNILVLCSLQIKARLGGRKVILISLFEHIGDIIASEPIIRNIHDTNKSALIVWVTNKAYKELQEKNPQINYIIGLEFFSEWIMLKGFLEKVFPHMQIADLHFNNKRCSKFKQKLARPGLFLTTENMYDDNRNLCQIFSIAAGLPEINQPPVFFINTERASSRPTSPYIVFHTQTNAAFKDWQPHLWTRLFEELSAEGYTVVEVGVNRQVNATSAQYIDYTGKKSLQSIANLIAGCTLFVGLDSGFAHMANALKVRGVVLMGQFIQGGEVVYTKYNPFSSLYSNENFIVNTEDGDTRSLGYEKVYQKVKEQLTKDEPVEIKSKRLSLEGQV